MKTGQKKLGRKNEKSELSEMARTLIKNQKKNLPYNVDDEEDNVDGSWFVFGFFGQWG